MERWKKVAALLSALCMLASLCACGGQPDGAGSDPPHTQDTQQGAAHPAPPSSAPDQTDPQKPVEEPTPPGPPAVSSEPLSLQKQFCSLSDWDGDRLLVRSEYSYVLPVYGAAADYPQLVEALEQTAAMVRRSIEDEYGNLCSAVREDRTGDNAEPWVSTLDIQVRRADSVVLSLLSDSYSDYGWIEDFRGMHGTNYDAQTGQELALNDIVDVNNDLADAVADELNSHQWAGDFDYRDAVQAYFANTPYDGFSWTLDYNGVTFYFADGDLEEPGNGGKTATVSFAEYPQLFDEKYMAVPDAYMVELPLDSSFFTDLDGDGDLEELNVTSCHEAGSAYFR